MNKQIVQHTLHAHTSQKHRRMQKKATTRIKCRSLDVSSFCKEGAPAHLTSQVCSVSGELMAGVPGIVPSMRVEPHFRAASQSSKMSSVPVNCAKCMQVARGQDISGRCIMRGARFVS